MRKLIVYSLLLAVAAPLMADAGDSFGKGFADAINRNLEARNRERAEQQAPEPTYEAPKASRQVKREWVGVDDAGNTVYTYGTKSACDYAVRNNAVSACTLETVNE